MELTLLISKGALMQKDFIMYKNIIIVLVLMKTKLKYYIEKLD